MEETQKAEHAAKPQKSGDVFWKVTTVVLIASTDRYGIFIG